MRSGILLGASVKMESVSAHAKYKLVFLGDLDTARHKRLRSLIPSYVRDSSVSAIVCDVPSSRIPLLLVFLSEYMSQGTPKTWRTGHVQSLELPVSIN
ncbi:hypothetical protein VNO78_07975 [Psophocarpus tetragonolobus]|uniref:Uncharacterized protein n=1 Tax=Psophocarpus tetragonolobus TaxID=3891 RepID=A0AAN9SWD3_PSOTE